MRGRFITLEGGEGTGKTTQTRMLADALAERGIPTLRTREPGGSPGAERLRQLLLGGEVRFSARAETLLHFAARADHVAHTIEPALRAGLWVVCDRFYDSTLAYQGYGQGADRELIHAQIALLGIKPDLTLVLTVPPEIARQRLAARGGAADRYEREGSAFHARVADGFLAIARADADRCRLIAAEGSVADVHARIIAAAAPP